MLNAANIECKISGTKIVNDSFEFTHSVVFIFLALSKLIIQKFVIYKKEYANNFRFRRAIGIELVEMMYQYDRDYVFDSSKFEKRFHLKPTPYLEGIKKIVNTNYK